MSRTNFSFYKYVPIDRWKYIIEDGTLLYNNPLRFNDPFDCNPVFTPEQLIRTIQNSFRSVGNMDISSDHAQRSIDMVPILHEGLLREMLCSNIGVTCFSLNHTNPPMWYHYASEHQGIVVEFTPTDDLPIETHQNDEFIKIHPQKVKYYPEGEIPKVHDNITPYDIVFHKTEHWEYEEEVRHVTFKSGSVKFDRIQIGKVFGGILIEPVDRTEIIEAIRKMNNETGGKAEYIQMKVDYKNSKITY